MTHLTGCQQHQQRCIHFTGLMQDTCKAGIRYRSVMGSDLPHSLPCLKEYNPAGMTCDRAEFMTDQQAQQYEVKVKAQVEDWIGKLKANICPHCNQPIQHKRQAGRCVYAEPCGHRLYQGRAA